MPATPPAVTLRVFANTGHQYFIVPLRELLPDKDGDFLARLARQNREPWKPWSEFTPWILHQYDVQSETGDDVPVLKLAVETNLGLPSRGLLFDVEDRPVADPPHQDDVTLPYASMDEAQIQSDYKHGVITLRQLPNKEGRPLEIDLRIHWPRRGGFDPVDVDLVVDLGNTRTVALLLETPGQDPATRRFEKRVSILRFIPRGSPYQPPVGQVGDRVLLDDCAIIDSWLLLHRSQFAHLEPPRNTSRLSTHYVPTGTKSKDGKDLFQVQRHLPHTFVELSPAIIGGGKRSPDGVYKIMAQVPLHRDARFQLSSPKRYAWDDEQQGFRGGTFWRQIPNDTDEPLPDFFDDLTGLFRYFMDPGERGDWDIDNPPGESEYRGLPFPNSPASFPRNATVCWFALTLIETACRQINSEYYLRLMGRESLPRRLRGVRVTFPAGWTHQERERYLEQWNRACKLFTLTRFEDHRPVSLVPGQPGGSRPVMTARPLDEAVCSQLPILFSDVTALHNDVEAWIELFGREDGVTAMNVDIGGGTTDVAIIRYESARLQQRDPAVRAGVGGLVPHLLFRDGYTIAGDVLVKRIIEQILLPTWLKVSSRGQYEAVPEAKDWIRHLFANPGNTEFSNVDPRASTRMMRIVRLVFIPIVNLWLTRFGGSDGDAPIKPVSIDDSLKAELLDKNTINDLNDLVDAVVRSKCEHGAQWEGPAFAVEGVELSCERAALESAIDAVFGELFDSLAPFVGRFDIDMVIVSGKPSELPHIRELLVSAFPLLPQRIVHVKNFPAGSWYPYKSFEDGRILDAKTCTVVGAALYQDICNGNLEGFSIVPEESKRVPRRYTWGVLSELGSPEEFHRNYLFTPADYPPADEGATELSTPPKNFTLPVNCRIGRQLTRMRDVRAEPVYELRWLPTNTPFVAEAVMRVTLRWVSRLGEGEKLELVRVEPHPDFPMVLPEDVTLRLNTLLTPTFWLDEPRFETDRLFT